MGEFEVTIRVRSVEKLIANGSDPLHALYANTLNLVSLFGEEVTTLPPLHQIHDFISKWLDIYQPSLPPMSPITKTYFTCWTMLDGAFGRVNLSTDKCCLKSTLNYAMLDIPDHTRYKPGYAS